VTNRKNSCVISALLACAFTGCEPSRDSFLTKKESYAINPAHDLADPAEESKASPKPSLPPSASPSSIPSQSATPGPTASPRPTPAPTVAPVRVVTFVFDSSVESKLKGWGVFNSTLDRLKQPNLIPAYSGTVRVAEEPTVRFLKDSNGVSYVTTGALTTAQDFDLNLVRLIQLLEAESVPACNLVKMKQDIVAEIGSCNVASLFFFTSQEILSAYSEGNFKALTARVTDPKSGLSYLTMLNYFTYSAIYSNGQVVISASALTGLRSEIPKLRPYLDQDSERAFQLIWAADLLDLGASELDPLVSFIQKRISDPNLPNVYRALSTISRAVARFPREFLSQSRSDRLMSLCELVRPAPILASTLIFDLRSFGPEAKTDTAWTALRSRVTSYLSLMSLPTVDRGARLWSIRILNEYFKVFSDSAGNSIDIQKEKEAFYADRLPFTLESAWKRYFTKLGLSRVQSLDQMLQGTESAISKILSGSPIKLASALQLIIAANPAEYAFFMPLFEDLSSANGGIYISERQTLYTFDRTASESYYTLDELMKHELTHAIQHRLRGTGEFWQEEKHWWAEGMAEFMVGAAPDGKVAIRSTLINLIRQDSRRMTVQQILEARPNPVGIEYRYSALFFNFLDQKQPGAIQAISAQVLDGKYFYNSYQANTLRTLGYSLDTLNTQFQEFLAKNVGSPLTSFAPETVLIAAPHEVRRPSGSSYPVVHPDDPSRRP
jgi:hypothetical protein